MIKDDIKLRGDLRIVITDSVTGKVKEDRLEKNLVVTTGRDFIASRMAGVTSGVMTHMAVGTNNTTPAANNTVLGGEIARVAVTVSGGTPAGNTVTYVASFPAGTGTGALQEAGIFNAGTSGTMLSRTTYAVINKGAADTMTITWVITVG